MKSISTFLAIFFSAVLVNGMNDPGAMMKIIKDCKASTGASEDDVGKIMSHADVTSKEAKCMFNCLMESMGVIKGGHILKDSAIVIVKSFGANDAIADEIVTVCSGMSDGDPCEFGAKLAACFKENGKKHGLDIGV